MPDDELLDDVRDWLNHGGYVLGMRVARIVRQFTNLVWQGFSYRDPVTSIEREADVGALIPLNGPGPRLHAIALNVECKQSQAPWVLFTGNVGSNGPAPRFDEFGDDCAECERLEIEFGRWIKALPSAYSMTEKRNQGPKQGKDHAFEAVQQAANVFVSERNPGRSGSLHEDPRSGISFRVPMVVTTSPLITVRLDDSAEPVLERTDRATVLVPRILDETSDGVEVLVVTIDALPDVLEAFCGLAPS